MKWLFLVLLLVSPMPPAAVATQNQDCIKDSICLRVIGQRWLTESDLRRLNKLSFSDLAIRLRLSNESDNEIVYLTGFAAVEPAVYRLYRKVGAKEWRFIPETSARSEPLFRRSSGGQYTYLRLLPHSSLEFEISDFSNPSRGSELEKGGYDEEHAFSLFIKLGGQEGTDAPIELVTEPFVPLKRVASR